MGLQNCSNYSSNSILMCISQVPHEIYEKLSKQQSLPWKIKMGYRKAQLATIVALKRNILAAIFFKNAME